MGDKIVIDAKCDEKCHSCCRWFFKNQRPKVTEEEAKEISEKTGLPIDEFTEMHKSERILKFKEDNWCRFIRPDGKCSIWPFKPQECSLYPIFAWQENGCKMIGIDLNCKAARNGFLEFDVMELFKNEALFKHNRPCEHFSRAIVIKGEKMSDKN